MEAGEGARERVAVLRDALLVHEGVDAVAGVLVREGAAGEAHCCSFVGFRWFFRWFDVVVLGDGFGCVGIYLYRRWWWWV